MTTIKEILDKFDAPNRCSEKFESVDIGNYTFDDADSDRTGYLMEFTNKENPEVFLRINDDGGIIKHIRELGDDTVDVTSWRMGKKANKQFLSEQFKPIPKHIRKAFLKK